MEIKTIEVQILSPNPKTGIIHEVLTSIHTNLETQGSKTLKDIISSVLSLQT